MNFSKFQKVISKINLRAAGALLIFLLSWAAAPVALLVQQPDTCSMECCVAEGHCCCAAPKLWVEGQDHSNVGEIEQNRIDSSCPCPVTPPSNSKIVSRQIAANLLYLLAPDESEANVSRREDSFYSSVRFSPDSSRAPPVFSC
ncbi:MAG: hypothetical protein KA368_02745 [Acidobacteria bacterium]|nr:hypothetical protein [Acidobacteriota bacterium]